VYSSIETCNSRADVHLVANSGTEADIAGGPRMTDSVEKLDCCAGAG
jgi:hypothetical protein